MKIPVFSWEKRLHSFIREGSSRIVKELLALNIALAGEESMTLLVPWFTLLVLWQSGGEASLLFLAAFLSSRHVEAWAKPLLGARGRPRNPGEHGMPSGDVAIATIWSVPILGWGAIPLVPLIAIARVAQSAHWPLDTVAGVIQGLLLLVPFLVRGWF